MNLEKLIIDAPFGMYFRPARATPVVGTFTVARRGGRWLRVWRAVTTIWYYRGLGAWKNRMRLPNPGVGWLYRQPEGWLGQSIISIMGFNFGEWATCVNAAAACKPVAVCANVGCPNCPGEDHSDYARVFPMLVRYAERAKVRLIVKLPPVGYRPLVSWAIDAGVTSFHACNTLPTPGGGLSGKPLKPLSLEAVVHVRAALASAGVAPDVLIGGGGVTHLTDALEYLKAGATNVAVGSAVLCPWNRPRLRRMALALAERSV